MMSEDKEINKINQLGQTVIPVIQEYVKAESKVIETGKIQITKSVTENNETVNVPLLHDEHFVEHVPVNVFVDDNLPSTRYEGDTLIIPVLKEVLVKRVLLAEEIRITKKTVQTNFEQKVPLQQQEVKINYSPLPGNKT